MKEDKKSMSDFGSNNLVPHIHVLFLNVDTKWKKNHVGRPNLGVGRTPQVWQMAHPNMST